MIRALAAVAIIASLFATYGIGFTSLGLVGPDEPRYASIGREMALSGDWLTPRLWGDAWFEKPPLEYWGIALGYKLGLGDDIAPRAFNTALGVLSLGAIWWLVRRSWGAQVAWTSAAILGASIGWIAESRIAVMDLPLAATFTVAVLLAIEGSLPVAGAALGFAMLAKGLVPLVLIAPLVVMMWRRWRELGLAAAACAAIAGPWYAAMLVRHGRVFFDEFFVKHHFSRFTETTLQHVQPWWFYAPVLAGLLFPWTPALAALRWPKGADDRQERLRMLIVVALWGLVFFSVSRNKLPGYILPIVPLVAIWIASAEERIPSWLWATCGAMLFIVPVAARYLPLIVASGLSRVDWTSAKPFLLMGAALAFGTAGVSYFYRAWGVAGSMVLALLMITVRALPAIDSQASARPLWQMIGEHRNGVCVERMHRAWRYGLNFYSVKPLPDCHLTPMPIRIMQQGSTPPEILLAPQRESPGPEASPDRDGALPPASR